MLTQLSDLTPYFERIGFTGIAKPDLESLRTLHRLHPFSIPFENLSPLLGEPVLLTADALENKLIHGQRGGYCFEQNALFMGVLRSIGFEVLPLAARVVWNRDQPEPNPRTHMALLVEIESERYLCDVGFGGATLTAPLLLRENAIQPTPHEPCRILSTDTGFTVEVRLESEWRAAYEFDLQRQLAIDYEAMNHFVQTHASSPFTKTLMVAKPDSRGRYTLRGIELRRYEDGSLLQTHYLDSAESLADVLQEVFRIALPADPRLPATLSRLVASGRA